ncbi:NADPH-dependent FMN reductase [Companilactobacillus nuruki]|uniref:NADPH-dependent oxidoreductase n=1 Tax=Companilactobacillus nuruki TaxID=1993540 RepID=A0A2N7AUJ7_9LACO|nr:NAD(P)H-dependent oxidoreductase [Companilactobacillus nuruki]PMD71165.1 NADPH-dependent oxidoreductase [Companilactobacillus nuruki]
MTVKIGVILGTVRTNSLGMKIFQYLENTFFDNEETEYTWIPLKDYSLPFYDHEEIPLGGHINELNNNEVKWLDTLKQQDGYIILSPEYDHSISGVLKNALDFVGLEVDHKPVQIITYSYYSDGGVLAANAIVPILQMLKMIVLPTPVLLWDADTNFTQGGLDMLVKNSIHFEKRLHEAFSDIEFYSKVLKQNPFLNKK